VAERTFQSILRTYRSVDEEAMLGILSSTTGQAAVVFDTAIRSARAALTNTMAVRRPWRSRPTVHRLPSFRESGSSR
jgi:hypothetical protein